MDILFKKYFFVIVLGTVAVAAYLMSQIVSTVIEGFLTVEPTGKTGSSRSRSQRGKKEDVTPNLNPGNIYSELKGKAEPVIDPEAASLVDSSNDNIDWTSTPTQSEIPAKVTGTLRHMDPMWSLATIQHEGDTHLYKIGSKIESRKVVAISDRHVYFANNGKLEFLEVTKGKKPKRKSKSKGRSKSSKTSKKNPVAEGVKKVSDTEWELDRTMLNEQLSDLNKLGTQARIIPNYKDGKYSGFKLIGIRPNSLYAAIGIRSGDVIKQISGEEITSPNQALALYDKLKTADSINLEIERRGQKRSHSYQVK